MFPPDNNHDDIADMISYKELHKEFLLNGVNMVLNQNAIEIIKTLIESLEHDSEYIEETRSRWYDEIVAKIEILNVVLSLLKVEDE